MCGLHCILFFDIPRFFKNVHNEIIQYTYFVCTIHAMSILYFVNNVKYLYYIFIMIIFLSFMLKNAEVKPNWNWINFYSNLVNVVHNERRNLGAK